MMQLRNKRFVVGIVVALLAISVVSNVSSAPDKVSRLTTVAEFSQPAKPWVAFIVGPSGKRLYKLTLEPERSVSRTIIGVNLLLQNVTGSTSENLLDPPGNWHGMQPYSFLARDLINGPAKSIFGAQRTIRAEKEGIVVEVHILKVNVTKAPGGDDQLDDLRLVVTVDNIGI